MLNISNHFKIISRLQNLNIFFIKLVLSLNFNQKTLSPKPNRLLLLIVSAMRSSLSPAPRKIMAEYAKSQRLSCKKCSKPIASSALRLGLISKNPRGFDMTKWHHLNCFPFSIFDSVSSIEAITGFSSLKVNIWILSEVSKC